MGRLDIRVCEARNMPDPQTFGKPDPYVIVKLEHQTHKTHVAENTTNPKWDDVIKFTVADENSAQLRFELWNKNMVSDDFLGCYTLSISGLTRGECKDEWFLLQQCKSNAELRVRVMAQDFGKIPAQGAAPASPQQQQAPPQQAPPQQPGGYPPQQGGYPPQQAPGGYPPQGPPPQQGYPPQQGGYPPQQQQGYPPQQGGYPPQQPGYPPQQGGYPPQQPGYPPQQPGYPPQQPGYPPQQPGYPPQQPGYPPQQPGYPPQQGYGGY